MRDEDGGVLPIGAVILYEMIPQPMSPRIFQRESLRGQTKYSIQFFFRLSVFTFIILILNE